MHNPVCGPPCGLADRGEVSALCGVPFCVSQSCLRFVPCLTVRSALRAAWLADGTAEADAAPDDAMAPDAADGTDALAPDDADDGCARVVVPDDAAPTPCRVCGEAFDVAWDATAGEWVLAAAVSVPVDDGTDAVVHRACRDAVCGRGGTLEAAALVPVPSPPPGPTAP